MATREQRRQVSASEMQIAPSPIKRFVQSGGGFHDSFDTPQKIAQRNAAINHLGKSLYATSCKNRRLLSLPGEKWILEREIFESCRLEIVGIEKDPITFQRSASWIPKRKNCYRTVKSSMTVRHNVIEGFGCYDVTHYLADLCIIEDVREQWFQAKGKTLSMPFSAFWMDTFSPLASRVGFAVPRILANTSNSDIECSFAFAFLIGRDDHSLVKFINMSPSKDAMQRRVDLFSNLIQKHGRSLEIDDVMVHDSWNSDGTSRIGTIFGRVLPVS